MADSPRGGTDPERALIEEAFGALNEGFADPDYDVEGTVQRIFHPEADLAPRYVSPDEQGLRGPAGAAEFIYELRRLFEAFELKLQELTGTGETRVATYTVVARVRDSEMDVRQQLAAVFRVREGKLALMRVYGDRAEALEAAGMGDAPA